MEKLTDYFVEILHDMEKLHDKKSSDYGEEVDPYKNVRNSEEWGVPAWVGAMVRACDKVKRLQTYAIKGSLENESVEDSFIDLAIYAVIALVLFRQDNDLLDG